MTYNRSAKALLRYILLPGLAVGFPAASRADEQDLDKRIDSLIQVFAHPQAAGDKLQETNEADRALVKIGARAVPKLVTAILARNETLAAYSGNTLDRIGKPAVPAVLASWPNLGEAARWKLMRFRGKFDYEAALDFALASLSSKDEDVRRQAIEYLCQHKEVRAKMPLLNALKTDSPRLRWGLLGGIVPYDDQVVDAHIELLSPTSWAAKGDGLTPPKGETPPWWPDGRPHVIHALGKMKARRAAPALLKVLREKGRGRAYLGPFILPLLGEFGHKESMLELKHILATDTEDLVQPLENKLYVQSLAARALWQLGDHAGRLPLVHLTRSKDGAAKEVACRTVAELGDKRDISVLVRCLDDSNSEVLDVACRGLERITGVVNRAPGNVEISAADAPVWKAWYPKYLEELRNQKQ